MRQYVAFYNGRQIVIEADSSYAAQLKAAKEFKAKKEYQVTVLLLDQVVDTASL